jgi:hypothetical protein
VEVVGVGCGIGGDLRRGVATQSACRRLLFTHATVADAVAFAEAPTARLSVAAVDGRGKPADIYVTEVRLGVRRG